MRFLVASDSDVQRQLIVTLLEARYSARVVEAGSGVDAIKALIANPAFDCAIGNQADVFTHIRENRLEIPCVLASDRGLEAYPELVGHELAGILGAQDMAGALARLVDSFELASTFHRAQATHCRVSLKVLRKIDFCNCDLFVRVADRFLKVKNHGEPIDDELVSRFENRGVESLYIRHADAAGFLAYLSQNILGAKSLLETPDEVSRLAQAAEKLGGDPLKRDVVELADSLVRALGRDTEIEAALGLTESARRQVRAAAQALAMTPELELVVKASIRLSLQTITSNSRLLRQFVNALKAGGSDFGARCTLICYVACALATALEWGSDFTRYKLALAAFLHDILLDDRLARCRRPEGLKGADAEAYAAHPEKTAALVRKMRDLPPDVDKIILQHHERPDGSGFPSHIDHSRMLPLSCVFIVADDLVRFALESGKDSWPVAEFLARFGPEYEVGSFKRIQAYLSGLPLG